MTEQDLCIVVKNLEGRLYLRHRYAPLEPGEWTHIHLSEEDSKLIVDILNKYAFIRYDGDIGGWVLKPKGDDIG